MAELYSTTLKYFRLAIAEFLPQLEKLKEKAKKDEIKENLKDIIEAYKDIARKIDEHNLNLEDPNRYYDGEPNDIEIDIPQSMVEELSRLSARLLSEWKNQHTALKKKKYLTDDNKDKIYKLERLIWPLEALSKAESYVLGKYAKKGLLVFPGEEDGEEEELEQNFVASYTPLFPRPLVELVSGAIKVLCEEFDFNFQNKNPNACMLLLRKIIPLAIVRKFQYINKEDEVKENGEFLQTKALLGKAKSIMSSPRIYDEIMDYKFLIDSSQHIFSVSSYMEDIPRPATAVRIMLEDFFNEE